eukprot:scaffold10261_cov269-Chaetoceros_neogracile.AAC.4
MQRLVQFGRLNQTLHGTDGPLASIWGDISTLRHEVYSIELNQYEVKLSGQLEDPGQYFIALLSGDSLLGYVSINAPERAEGFRLAKYYSEEVMNELLHFSTFVESKTFEIRALTIKDQFRGKGHAFSLMQAALHFSIAEGATDLIAMGHTSVLEMYKKLGMKVLEQHHVTQIEAQVGAQALACSGALTNVIEIKDHINEDDACYHGGASWGASGFNFNLRKKLVVADVLDSPFPPCPEVIEVISCNIESCCQESPPTQCEELIEKISHVRRVPSEHVLVSSGSSSLMFSLLPKLIHEHSSVLILSPMYGEYLHILSHVIGCNVTQFPLYPEDDFEIDRAGLIAESRKHDAVIFVNPNSPTGVYSHEMRGIVQEIVEGGSQCKTIWIDETHIEYLHDSDSLEGLTGQIEELIICKSMSKCYALSGLRVAYVVTSKASFLRHFIPPWAVSLPAQLAAITALDQPEYYAKQYEMIHRNRTHLSQSLVALGFKIYPGVANCILTELPTKIAVSSGAFVQSCRERGVYVRDAENMGLNMDSKFVRFAVRMEDENKQIVSCIEHLMRPIVPDQTGAL